MRRKLDQDPFARDLQDVHARVNDAVRKLEPVFALDGQAAPVGGENPEGGLDFNQPARPSLCPKPQLN